MEIRFTHEHSQNLREALELEWLDTNGLGGYASSTVVSCHTRRYHGYLVASLDTPPGRFVLLSGIDETLVAQGREFPLSCHKFPGVFHPHGHRHLEEFRLDHGPHAVYRVGGIRIHKSVMMVHGENTVLVRYFVERADAPFSIQIRPLLAFRAADALTSENIFLQVRTFPIENGFKIQPYNGMPPLCLTTNIRPGFSPSPLWYRQFEYVTDEQRGYPGREDLFQPGVFEFPLRTGRVLVLRASTSDPSASPLDLWKREASRRATPPPAARATARAARSGESPAVRLAHQADDFLVRWPGGEPAVVAGYPWFGSWGRDTLISLPGLTFCRGRADEGAAILLAMAAREHKGLIPNCIGSDGRAAYNSVDASLWLFWAVQQLRRYGGSDAVVRDGLWPAMKRILAAFARGTDFGIGMAPSGLLRAGDADTQLTWMDARLNGRPVTPRHGFPVEVNALWYNAVCEAVALARTFGDSGFAPPAPPEQIAAAFRAMFWYAAGGCLGDVHDGARLDASVRPNQVFAVSLPHSPLEPDQATAVVRRVRDDLLTPFGLRTLSPTDPRYRGRYAGSPEERDRSYHQGTAWPWLLGHFGDAMLRVSRNRSEAVAFLRRSIAPLLDNHLSDAGLGSISEVFDGDPPHRPNGCIAQAWSVAEILRLLKVLDSPSRRKGG